MKKKETKGKETTTLNLKLTQNPTFIHEEVSLLTVALPLPLAITTIVNPVCLPLLRMCVFMSFICF